MGLAAAALLGVVQGLTEFLPVSSSAHLVLARAFFGWDVDEGSFGLAFDVALHLGTLIAILIYFRRDIAAMLAAVPEAISANRGPAKVARLIAIGTIPAVIVGSFEAWSIHDRLFRPRAVRVAYGPLMNVADLSPDEITALIDQTLKAFGSEIGERNVAAVCERQTEVVVFQMQ